MQIKETIIVSRPGVRTSKKKQRNDSYNESMSHLLSPPAIVMLSFPDFKRTFPQLLQSKQKRPIVSLLFITFISCSAINQDSAYLTKMKKSIFKSGEIVCKERQQHLHQK